LFLGFPEDGRVTKKHDVARDGTTSGRITGPIRITIRCQLQCAGTRNEQILARRLLDIM